MVKVWAILEDVDSKIDLLISFNFINYARY